MGCNTIKQHFIPRCYLRRFTGVDGKLRIYNISEGRSYITTPDKAFNRRYEYEVVKSSEHCSNIFEDILGSVELRYNNFICKLEGMDYNIDDVGIDEFYIILEFCFYQFIRSIEYSDMINQKSCGSVCGIKFRDSDDAKMAYIDSIFIDDLKLNFLNLIRNTSNYISLFQEFKGRNVIKEVGIIIEDMSKRMFLSKIFTMGMSELVLPVDLKHCIKIKVEKVNSKNISVPDRRIDFEDFLHYDRYVGLFPSYVFKCNNFNDKDKQVLKELTWMSENSSEIEEINGEILIKGVCNG